MDEEVKNLFEDFEEALNDDKIYIAFELLKQLQFKSVGNELIIAELEKRKEQTMQCQMLYTKIKVQVEDMRRDKNWTLVSKKRGISVYHRETEDSSIMNKATVEFTMEDKRDVPREFVKLLSLVFHPGALVPLSKRDGIALGRGFDLSENGEVVITYDTLPDGVDETGFLVPEVEAKYIRLTANGAFYFGLKGRTIIFSVINRVDVKVKSLPASVLTFISRHLWSDFAFNFRKAWKFYEGSQWETRVEEKKQFYDQIHERIATSLKLDVKELAVYEAKIAEGADA